LIAGWVGCHDPSTTCREWRGTPVGMTRKEAFHHRGHREHRKKETRGIHRTKDVRCKTVPRFADYVRNDGSALGTRAEMVEEGLKGVVGEVGGVGGGGGQAADCGGDRVGGEIVELVEFPSLN
jgi:hypothetical protein